MKTHQAALALFVTPGLLYRFGEIHVKSDPGARILPVFVWEQVRLAIAEGELYSDDALQEAERRLFGMAVFASARVIAEEPDDATRLVALRVVVREGPFRTLRLGGGVRADQIRNEVRLISEWTNRNFLGGMRKLSLRAEAGWAFIPNVYEAYDGSTTVAGARDGPIGRLRLSFEQPRFLGRPSLREITTLESERTLEQSYNSLSNRLHTGVSWQVRSTMQIYPAYHLEADYLNGSPVSGAVASPLTLGCKTTDGQCLVWLVVPRAGLHLGSPEPHPRAEAGLPPQPGAAGGGRAAAGRLHLYARAPRRARLLQLRGGRRADALGAPAGRRPLDRLGESRRQRGDHPLLLRRRRLDARLQRSPAVAAAARPGAQQPERRS